MEKGFWGNLFEQIFYFIIAIMVFNSIGVWLPAAIDYYNSTTVSKAVYESTPLNLMTYFLGLITVGIIDRIKKLFKMTNHPFKSIEFYGWIIFVVIITIVVFFLMKNVKDKNTSKAIDCSIIGLFAAYIVWWISYYMPPSSDPYSSLGGDPTK